VIGLEVEILRDSASGNEEKMDHAAIATTLEMIFISLCDLSLVALIGLRRIEGNNTRSLDKLRERNRVNLLLQQKEADT
jgi:hypothetical protein